MTACAVMAYPYPLFALCGHAGVTRWRPMRSERGRYHCSYPYGSGASRREACGGACGILEGTGACNATSFAAHYFHEVARGLARLGTGGEELERLCGESVYRVDSGSQSVGKKRGDGRRHTATDRKPASVPRSASDRGHLCAGIYVDFTGNEHRPQFLRREHMVRKPGFQSFRPFGGAGPDEDKDGVREVGLGHLCRQSHRRWRVRKTRHEGRDIPFHCLYPGRTARGRHRGA